MRAYTLIIVCGLIALTTGNVLGGHRKRFGPNPNSGQRELNNPGPDKYRSLPPQVYDSPPTGVSGPPPPAPCCRPVYEDEEGHGPAIAPGPQGPGPAIAPGPGPGTGSGTGDGVTLPDGTKLPPPVRPNLYYQKINYTVYDQFHSRYLDLFDPEEWILQNPYAPFPLELDIPTRWYVYNAVTVQAPLPYVDMKALRERFYSGYYYSCPESTDPYQFSWFMKNEAVNPCKWTFYQSLATPPAPVPIAYHRAPAAAHAA